MNKVPTLLLIAVLTAGCGVYTLNPKGKSDIKTIAIEPLENATEEFGLADRLTVVLVDAFIADGSMKVVPADQADAILVGTLLSYERVPETFDANDQVERYKVIMNFDLRLLKSAGGGEYWNQKTRQEGIYNAADSTEEDGQRLAGERLVQAVIDKTTKSW